MIEIEKKVYKDVLYEFLNVFLDTYQSSLPENKEITGYKNEQLSRLVVNNILQKFIVFHISQMKEEEIPKSPTDICKYLSVDLIEFRTKNSPVHKKLTQASLDALLIDFINFIAKKEDVFPFTTKSKLNIVTKLFEEEEKTEDLIPFSETPEHPEKKWCCTYLVHKDTIDTIAKAHVWKPTMYLRYKKSEGIGYGLFLQQLWFNETDGSEEWRDIEGAM